MVSLSVLDGERSQVIPATFQSLTRGQTRPSNGNVIARRPSSSTSRSLSWWGWSGWLPSSSTCELVGTKPCRWHCWYPPSVVCGMQGQGQMLIFVKRNSNFWLLSCPFTYRYVRVQQTGDPSYSTYDDLTTYTSVKVNEQYLLLRGNSFAIQPHFANGKGWQGKARRHKHDEIWSRHKHDSQFC